MDPIANGKQAVDEKKEFVINKMVWHLFLFDSRLLEFKEFIFKVCVNLGMNIPK